MKLNPLRWFEKPVPAKPLTIDSAVAGSKHEYFGKRNEDLLKCRYMYEQGGMVSEAIDCHPLFMFSSGYKFEHAEGKEKLAEQVQTWHDQMGFEEVAWRLIVDSLVVKKGIGEIAPSRDGTVPVAKVFRRPSEQFTEIYDDSGDLTGYKQTVIAGGVRKSHAIPADRIFRLDLGLPLVARCKDDIIRDTKIVDATAASIGRHGFPRYHVKVGVTGQTISDDVVSKLGSEFEQLEPDHEWVTVRDVDISNIDSAGVQNTKLYGDWAIQRLCAALGTPEEMLGLGRGSTEATANVRLKAWYDRMSTLQKRFAAQWNDQIVDRMTGSDGDVWLAFNDPNPTDDEMRARTVASLLSLGVNAPITLNEARVMLGLQPSDEFEMMAQPVIPTGFGGGANE